MKSHRHPFWAAIPLLFAASLVPALPARAVDASSFRRLADAAVMSRQFEQAARYYRLEAAVYRSRGDLNGAKVEEMKADRWSTEVQLFADTPPNRRMLLSLYTGAKYEPVYGCYLGAFVAGDPRLDTNTGDWGNARYADRAAALGALIQKPLATSWDYCSYGASFPRNWARALLSKGIAPHIAWEPNHGLDGVQSDDYLYRFARDAAACDGPVFLRFAGEMNGDWTAWHSDPELYRAKFRLVHDVMARIAPNVAMIWCLNSIPEYNMDDYYPGDAYVDWVGVNFYSVIHHDNDPNRPAWFENPASLLNYVYHRYAARKPIAICEYGASHRERLDPTVDYSDLACGKLAELLAALPRQYPRVKLVGIFDNDNLSGADVMPGRQLNDYSITDSPAVLAALTRAVASDYFLPAVVRNVQQDLPTQIRGLSPGGTLSGVVHLSAWVKSYEERPTVRYSLDGRELAYGNIPGDYRLDLDTTKLSPGPHKLRLDVIDSRGQLAGRREVTIAIAPAATLPPIPAVTTTTSPPQIHPRIRPAPLPPITAGRGPERGW